MNSNRKVICAGCQEHYLTVDTTFYRRKRWCGSDECLQVIDKKISHFNHRKQQKKLANGTYRHGVPIAIKTEIIKRDNNYCKLCDNECQQHKAQVHHIVPVSHDGKDEYTNLILLCSDCHTTVHKNGWESFKTQFENYTFSVNQ